MYFMREPAIIAMSQPVALSRLAIFHGLQTLVSQAVELAAPGSATVLTLVNS